MTLELDLQGMVGLQMPHQINTFDLDAGVTDDAAMFMLCIQVVTTMNVMVLLLLWHCGLPGCMQCKAQFTNMCM